MSETRRDGRGSYFGQSRWWQKEGLAAGAGAEKAKLRSNIPSRTPNNKNVGLEAIVSSSMKLIGDFKKRQLWFNSTHSRHTRSEPNEVLSIPIGFFAQSHTEFTLKISEVWFEKSRDRKQKKCEPCKLLQKKGQRTRIRWVWRCWQFGPGGKCDQEEQREWLGENECVRDCGEGRKFREVYKSRGLIKKKRKKKRKLELTTNEQIICMNYELG